MKRFVWLVLGTLCVAEAVIGSPVWAQQHHGSLGVESTSDEADRQYSIFMHSVAGVFLMAIGGLAFLSGFRRWGLMKLNVVWPFLWIALGVFLLVRSDPEAWPIGPAGFWESFSLPTAHEIVQHKVLAGVVILIGVFDLLRLQGVLTNRGWSVVMPALWMVAALALLLHRHLDHPAMDLANMQHLSWGIQSLLLAGIRLLEELNVLRWSHASGLWTVVLAVLGVQLALYTE